MSDFSGHRKPVLIDSVPVKNTLGEGVIWDNFSGCVWWTDIEGRLMYQYHLASQTLDSWPTPERVGCFALVEGADFFIVGFESGFAYFNPMNGWRHQISAVEPEFSSTRLNDGRTDRQGRFWAGSMTEDDQSTDEKGALYCLNPDLTCEQIVSGLSISNSLCWSPDSAYLYHTDTPSRRIDRYDFDSDSAAVSNRVTFVETPENHMPDGSIVDAEGYLWNAQWGASRIVRYSPYGEIDLVLDVPASQPTCVAFGGPNLDLLFVTSATEDLSEDQLERTPQAGNMFIYQTVFRGLIESSFKPYKTQSS